jgi:hypothetical protein
MAPGQGAVAVRRGDIWWVNLDPAQGKGIRKTRPIVVITADARAGGFPGGITPRMVNPAAGAFRSRLGGRRGGQRRREAMPCPTDWRRSASH